MFSRRSIFKVLIGLPFIGKWFKPKEPDFSKFVIPCISSRFPQLKASDIVSVQPMTEYDMKTIEFHFVNETTDKHCKIDPDHGILDPKGCCT